LPNEQHKQQPARLRHTAPHLPEAEMAAGDA
jgi:hypothetical protein